MAPSKFQAGPHHHCSRSRGPARGPRSDQPGQPTCALNEPTRGPGCQYTRSIPCSRRPPRGHHRRGRGSPAADVRDPGCRRQRYRVFGIRQGRPNDIRPTALRVLVTGILLSHGDFSCSPPVSCARSCLPYKTAGARALSKRQLPGQPGTRKNTGQRGRINRRC
jgi:hypothetical protein